ncbi:hypothetical protein GQ457_14G014000 [Hibiscus cannabinus]
MPGNNPNAMPQRNPNNFYADLKNNQKTLEEYREEKDITMHNLAVSVQNLEIQIGQIASALNNRPQGAFPSDTEDPR